MEAADCLYGVSMAGNGVSKVVSRRLPARRRGGARGLTADAVRRHRLRAQRLAGAQPAAPADVVRQLVGIQAQDRAAAALAVRVRGGTMTRAQTSRGNVRRGDRPHVGDARHART